jgi:hypothetical protein
MCPGSFYLSEEDWTDRYPDLLILFVLTVQTSALPPINDPPQSKTEKSPILLKTEH